MISRVLRDDPEADKQIIHHYDPVTKRVVIESVQRVDDLMDSNHAEQVAHSDWRPFSRGDWHRVASIPMNLYMQLKGKGIADNPAAMKRWLNDRDNQLFRTMPGKV